MEVHVGCSGWFYGHWRGLSYPEVGRTDHWFRHYTENFRTVELNPLYYSNAELMEHAVKLRDSRARDAWIYFDNDRDAFAIKNARTLIQQLHRMGLEVQ